MKKKKLAFLFGFTPNLSFAAANAAIGINRYMSIDDYDIVMFYTDLPKQDIDAFKKIPHVKLRKFNLPEKFIENMMQNMPNGRFKSRNALMCFCHFECFGLLDEYENVVWNDVDIGVQGDLADIIKYAPLGLTPDTPWKVRDQFTDVIPGYDMDVPSWCTSIMVCSDSLPYKNIYKFLYDNAEKYVKYLINPDQSIINIMFQEFNLKPKEVPLDDYGCISWKDNANIAKIVHFGTEKKVWNNTNICNSFPEWYRNHLLWLKLGGTDFDQSKITPRNPRGALDCLDSLQQEKNKVVKRKTFLFGVLPIWKIKMKSNKKWHYLFGVIPLFKTKDFH